MSASPLLEIQNRTPFPLTWAHLARPDDPPGRAPQNLLARAIPSRRGLVVGAVEAGRAQLVCGLLRRDGEERTRVESAPLLLGPDEAWSACVEYVREPDAFTIRWIDARVPARERSGDRPASGNYRWQGRRGEPRYKRSESARRGSR